MADVEAVSFHQSAQVLSEKYEETFRHAARPGEEYFAELLESFMIISLTDF